MSLREDKVSSDEESSDEESSDKDSPEDKERRRQVVIKLKLLENGHGLELIGKKLMEDQDQKAHPSLIDTIDKQINRMKLNCDESVLKQFVSPLKETIIKYSNIDKEASDDSKNLKNLYLKVFYKQKWIKSWLKYFSFYSYSKEKLKEIEKIEDTISVCFSTDTLLSGFINDCVDTLAHKKGKHRIMLYF